MATYNFANGVDAVPGWGQRNRFRFLGTWVAGESWSVSLVTTLTGDITLGTGFLNEAQYNYALVYADRVFIANGDMWNFSALLNPLGWEQQDVGAGFQAFTTSYGVDDSAISLAITQGRLAVFGRQNIQIWEINSDPSQFSRVQILQNAGTVAPDSVQSIGELDVLYLDDTGVRSLRTKETTLNAYVDDVGAPIDSIIQSVLLGLTDEEKAQAKSIVDPQSKRYWLYLDGTIYVLSRFLSSKITAWSTYLPTGKFSFPIVDKTFVPIRFFIHEGKVHVYATTTAGTEPTALFVYGGADGTDYGDEVVTVDLPWISLEKPATNKQALGLDAAFKGAWKLYASMNPTAAAMQLIVDRGSVNTPNSLSDSTYDVGHFTWQANGTHIHLKAVSTAAVEAQTLSMLTFQYNMANRK